MFHRLFFPLALLGALVTATLPAAAQWQWVDAYGKKIFSDTPPPPDVPPEKILRRPKVATSPGGADAPAPASVVAPSPGNPLQQIRSAGTDPRLEEQKRRAEQEEKAREQEQQARTARLRQENCERARRSKITLTSGQILTHTNEKGERGYMNEATRQAELERAESMIASNCDG